MITNYRKFTTSLSSLRGVQFPFWPLESIQSLSLTVRCVQERYLSKFWQLLTIAVDVLLSHDIARPKCTLTALHAAPGESRYDRETDGQTPDRYITLSATSVMTEHIKYAALDGPSPYSIWLEALGYLYTSCNCHVPATCRIVCNANIGANTSFRVWN